VFLARGLAVKKQLELNKTDTMYILVEETWGKQTSVYITGPDEFM
jgi:hypothetical protein